MSSSKNEKLSGEISSEAIKNAILISAIHFLLMYKQETDCNSKIALHVTSSMLEEVIYKLEKLYEHKDTENNVQ